MRRNSVHLISAALAGALALACATGNENGAASKAAGASEPRGGEPVDTVCFTGGLSGFYSAGANTIVLRRSVNDAYLVATGHCPNLRSVEGVRIDDPSNCLSRGDRLLVYDAQFPMRGDPSDRPDRCLVMAIHKWREVKSANES